jgi:hypothetical protein
MATEAALVEEPVVIGRCHLCQDRFAEIVYCGLCEHWFCESCRGRWFWRGLEFVRQLAGGRQPGCCGPAQSEVH